jgi:hypothetical protein
MEFLENTSNNKTIELIGFGKFVEIIFYNWEILLYIIVGLAIPFVKYEATPNDGAMVHLLDLIFQLAPFLVMVGVVYFIFATLRFQKIVFLSDDELRITNRFFNRKSIDLRIDDIKEVIFESVRLFGADWDDGKIDSHPEYVHKMEIITSEKKIVMYLKYSEFQKFEKVLSERVSFSRKRNTFNQKLAYMILLIFTIVVLAITYSVAFKSWEALK